MIPHLFLAVLATVAVPRDGAPVRFSTDVAPILVRKCLACHDDRKAQSGLNMRTFAGLRKGGKVSASEIVVPGKPEESALIDSIRADAEPRMPFKLPPLSDVEIAILERWVQEGANFDGTSEADMPIRSLVDATAGLPKVAMRATAVEPVTAIEFSPDARNFAAAVGRSVLLFDTSTGRATSTLADHPGPITRILFASNGKRLIAVGGKPGEFGSVRIWDIASRAILHDLRGHSDSIIAADLSADGSMLATGSYDRLVKLWDLNKAIEVRTLKEHTDAVHAVAFAPDGRTVASASGDRTVKLWNSSTGEKRLTLSDSTAELYAVLFGPGGKTIVAAGVDRAIRTWELDATNARLVRSALAHEAPVIRLSSTPDRSLIASASEDRSVKLWDAGGGPAKLVLSPQSDWPLALSLSADGRLVAVGRYDGSIELFDARSGARKAEVRRPGGEVATKPKLVGNPTLNPISPRSLVRGAKARVTLGGTGVGEASDLIVSETGLSARIVPREKLDPNALDIDLEVQPDAMVGAHTLAVRTTLGATPSQPLLITASPESVEREPNDAASAATSIPLPSTISGVIDKPGDTDFFRFRAEANQELTFDLYAKSLGSPLNARMRIDSEDGRTLASSNDVDGRPTLRLAFRPDASADYILRVEDQDLGGSGGHLYRINAGAFPRVDSASPLAVATGQRAQIRLEGTNLGEPTVSLGASDAPAGRLLAIVPTSATTIDRSTLPRAVVADGVQIVETESKDLTIESPGGVTGTILRDGEVDLFRFHAKKGHRLIIETYAQRLGTPTDTVLEILDAAGQPVPRAVLLPVEQTNVAFRDHASLGKNIRLTQWDRFAENDFVLIGRELTRIDELPRNPDDDAIMWGTGVARGGPGERLAFLETTPEHHPLNQPIHKVEIYAPDASLPTSSGIKPVTLFYRNDDGGPEFGKDSRITFDPPADGTYTVRVEDVRGDGSPAHRYHLVVREPRPDFRLQVNTANPNIPRGGTALVQVDAKRIDGFSSAIDLKVVGLPPGITAEGTRIGADGYSAAILLSADQSAESFTPPTWKIVGTAHAEGQAGQPLVREFDPGGSSAGFITIRPVPPLMVRTSASTIRIRPGERVELTLSVERVEGFVGRVPIEVRNLPRGVRVLNIGLNGVLVTPGQTERTITIQADPWARPESARAFYAVATCEATGTEHSSPPISLILEPVPTETSKNAPSAR